MPGGWDEPGAEPGTPWTKKEEEGGATGSNDGPQERVAREMRFHRRFPGKGDPATWDKDEYRHFRGLLEKITTGSSFCDVYEEAVKAVQLSDTRVGWVLRESGRVPFPLVENGSASPAQHDGSYPPDEVFPLPLPEIPPLPKHGRGRLRGMKRAKYAQLFSGVVAAVNVLFFGPNPERVCFPKGRPASACHHRCLGVLHDYTLYFLRGIEEGDRLAAEASLPSPSSFPGGIDSCHAFIRDTSFDSPTQGGTGGASYGAPVELTPERADLLEKSGELDPVVILRDSRPELLSLIVQPETWLRDPLPPRD